MKKCVAAIKVLEHARCKLERAVADEAARHRQAEAAAAASRYAEPNGHMTPVLLYADKAHFRVAQDATEALLQQSLEAAAVLHQRLAAVELQVGAPRAKTQTMQATSPCVSPGIAAVRRVAGRAVEDDPQVHVNPLFATGSRALSSVTLPSSVSKSGGTASPASRAASATLSSIAVKLKELQRHLQATPEMGRV